MLAAIAEGYFREEKLDVDYSLFISSRPTFIQVDAREIEIMISQPRYTSSTWPGSARGAQPGRVRNVLQLRDEFRGFEVPQDIGVLASPQGGLCDLSFYRQAVRRLPRPGFRLRFVRRRQRQVSERRSSRPLHPCQRWALPRELQRC